MKRIILLFSAIILSIFLAACGGSDPEYSIVEKDAADAGGKSTVRMVMEDPTDEDIQEVVESLYTDEFFGSASIHAYIHEPSDDDEFGAMTAMAKYAHTEDGTVQLGVEETGKVYVEQQ